MLCHRLLTGIILLLVLGGCSYEFPDEIPSDLIGRWERIAEPDYPIDGDIISVTVEKKRISGVIYRDSGPRDVFRSPIKWIEIKSVWFEEYPTFRLYYSDNIAWQFNVGRGQGQIHISKVGELHGEERYLFHGKFRKVSGPKASFMAVNSIGPLLRDVFLLVLFGFGFLGSFSLALSGYIREPRQPIFQVLFSRYWAIVGAFLSFLAIGMFGRGEFMLLPWNNFIDEMSNGFIAALASTIALCTAYLWFLWIPAHLWIVHHRDAIDEHRIPEYSKIYLFCRGVNVLVGAVLISPDNSFYRFIELL